MKRFLLMFVICVSSFMIYTNNVKASILTADYNPSNPNIQSSISFSSTDSNKSSPSYNYLFRNQGQGTLIFTMISKGGSPFFPISQVTLWVGNGSTNKYYTCEMGTSMTYDDNGGQNIVNTISCPVDLSNNYGLRSINFYRVATGSYLNIWPSRYLTFVQDTSTNSRVESQYIIDSINSAIAQVISGNSGNTQLILNKIDNQTTTIINKLNEISTANNNINNNLTDIKDSINSDNTTGAESSADDLKNNSAFQDNSGLSGVISMPLTFVNSLTNTCQPINLNIPYMDVDVTIPCMQSVITDKMPLLANLIKIIVNGFIVYRILLDIFQIVRNAKNPEDDRIEVLDL